MDIVGPAILSVMISQVILAPTGHIRDINNSHSMVVLPSMDACKYQIERQIKVVIDGGGVHKAPMEEARPVYRDYFYLSPEYAIVDGPFGNRAVISCEYVLKEDARRQR